MICMTLCVSCRLQAAIQHTVYSYVCVYTHMYTMYMFICPLEVERIQQYVQWLIHD